VLAVVFVGVWVFFRSRGGYRAVSISDSASGGQRR